MEKISELLKGCIINLDKPKGIDSHQIAVEIKRLLENFGEEIKIGHGGTLDPPVTGVLPILIGKARKLSIYLLEDKEYEGIMYLHEEVDIKKLKETIKGKFTGKIKQTPPSRAAVKREEREREIYRFTIKEVENNPQIFQFKVHCQSGTYIRTLIDDLGQELGTGAHMQSLRRTRDCMLDEKDSVTFEKLSEAIEKSRKGDSKSLEKYLLPMETIAKNMQKIEIKEEFVSQIRSGSPIFKNFIKKKLKLEEGQKIAVFEGKKLMEISKAHSEGDIIAMPETVLGV